MKRSRFALVLMAIAVVAMLLMLLPNRVEAADVTCGSSVSGHVVLTHDLACTDATGGLTVAADGTTIDLNGWTINCTQPVAGPGFKETCQGLGTVGIDTAKFDNVTIKGRGHGKNKGPGPATINGFHIGVHVNGGQNVNVRNLLLTGVAKPASGSNDRPSGATGIQVTGTVCADPADTIVNIHGNETENHTAGIRLVNADCVNVGHNWAHDNNSDPVQCFGILATNSSNNNFNNNLVEFNGENLGTDGGIMITGLGSANNTVTHNDVSNNFGDGISLRDKANNNTINSNTAKSNTDGRLRNFADLTARDAGAGNLWDPDNICNNQFSIGANPIPAGVCNAGE